MSEELYAGALLEALDGGNRVEKKAFCLAREYGVYIEYSEKGVYNKYVRITVRKRID